MHSPSTGATRHHHRAPVRYATSSPSRSGALSPESPCSASAWGSREIVEEHLPGVWPLGVPYRSRHGSAPCALHRMLSVLLRAKQALLPGQPRWLMGHAKRATGLCQAGHALCRLAMKSAVGLGPCPISARWPENSRNSFSFFWISLDCFKLQNSSLCIELQKL
jgi:hypothetical protein